MKDILNYFKNLGTTLLLALLCIGVGICGPAMTRLVIQETKKETKKSYKKTDKKKK